MLLEQNFTHTRQNGPKGKAKAQSRVKQEYNQEKQVLDELTNENNRLKKMLKQAQAKRTQITKQCSQICKKVDELQSSNSELQIEIKQFHENEQGQRYRAEELKFLNKQLASEIEELSKQNTDLSQKLRYNTEILEKKFETLEEKTFKRIQQAMKRIKKGIHYLQSLSPKQIEKTKEILIDNLKKAAEILKGKINKDDFEGQIEELMNPLRSMQEQINIKMREIATLKCQISRLSQQNSQHKLNQKEHLPMYKEAVQKLKKNLEQVRLQLSENQIDKVQMKKKYEEKIKQLEHDNNELFKDYRKTKLEKKIFQNKIQEMEADAEEQKQRLYDQNQMLKKLCLNQSSSKNKGSLQESLKQDLQQSFQQNAFHKDKTKVKSLKKNHSTRELGGKNKFHKQGSSFYGSVYQDQNSISSQESLKKQICKIDEDIMQIHRNLSKELELYQ